MRRGACVSGVLALLAAGQLLAAQTPVVAPRTFTFAPDGRNGVLILHGMGGTAHAAGRYTNDPLQALAGGLRFPTFSIRDMVRVHKALLDHRGVKHLVVVSGVSTGGYQALELICTFPDLADGAIPVVARGRSPAQHALDTSSAACRS